MPVQEERPPPIAVHEAWLPAEHPLHRPRHGGRQRTALLSALVFFLVPVLAVSLGVRPAEFENRALAGFPTPTDGWGFFTGLPAWATDHLPFRDVAVRVVDGLSRGAFGEPATLGPGTDGSTGPVGPVAPPAATAPPEPTGPADPSTSIPGVFPQVIEGEDGWLYFGYDVEGKCAPTQPLTDTIVAVNRLQTAVEASGRRFVLVVPPDKTTAQPEFLPADYPGLACAQAATRDFWRRVPAEAGAIDLRAELRQLSTPSRPIYHRLDTHWTDRGAVTMVRTLAEEIAPDVTRGWDVEQIRTVQSGADLPNLLGRTGVNFFEQYSLAPSGAGDRTGRYLNDLREPVRIGTGPASAVVPGSVVLLGDSFIQSSARYLAAGFAEVHVVSYATAAPEPQRIADLMADQEVIVLEVVERNFAAGTVPLLDPAALDVIIRELATRPLN
ncbi:MAG: hypothetical protein H0W37_04790 [Pseudonocardiales bacterium]|nr:hypothetical protein [Pseudonocardiales bacterium]